MSATTKPAKRAAAKKAASRRPAAAPGPDAAAVDQLIADANVDTSTFPTMVGLHQVSRRRKAQLMTAMQNLPDNAEIETLIRTVADGDGTDLAAAARLMDVMADVEDILAAFAVDEPAFRMWAQIATEVELIALMGQVMRTAGEASSSSS